MPEIISRQDAYAKGLKRYFTGKTCKHGHMSERYVQTQGCIACLRLTGAQFRVNPITRQLQPYLATKLWMPVTLTPADVAGLEPYLQQCISHYAECKGLLTQEMKDALEKLAALAPKVKP